MLTGKLYLIGRQPLRVAAASMLVVTALGATSGRAVAFEPGGDPAIGRRPGAAPGGTLWRAGRLPAGSEGDYFVVDRRGHTVSRIDRAMTAITPLLAIGHEAGRVLRPFGFDLGVGEFAIADAPGATERVQVFTTSGSRVSAFTLSSRSEAQGATGRPGPQRRQRHAPDESTHDPAESTRHRRPRQRVRHPGPGAPERGHTSRHGSRWRCAVAPGVQRGPAGAHSWRRPLFRLPDGRSRFRKYNAAGTLVFERAIQGRELDALVQTQPTTWPRRPGSRCSTSRSFGPGPGGHRRPARTVVDQLHGAVHLRVQSRRRENTGRPVSRRRSGDADQSLLHARWQATGDTRLLRLPSVVRSRSP